MDLPAPRLYTCKFCKNQLSFVELMEHFRCFFCSARRFGDALECGEPGCYRVFSAHDNFKRHILRCHPPTRILVIDPPDEPVDSSCLVGSASGQSSQLELSSSSIPPLLPSEDGLSDSDDDDIPMSNMTIESVQKTLEEGFVTIITDLMSNTQVPINFIQHVHASYSNHYSSVVKRVLNTCMHSQQSSVEPSSAGLTPHDTVTTLIAGLDRASKNFRSHAMRLKYFRELGTYIPPSRVVVGYKDTRVGRGGVSTAPCYAQHVPMGSVLAKLFSSPNFMKEIDDYLALCPQEDTFLVNIVQGDSWKKQTEGIRLQDHERLYPIILFQDDFEVGNPLGSHATIHKLGAVYFWLPCLPKRIASQLRYIFVTLLYHSSDLKDFGNDKIFKEVINDLNTLSLVGVDVDVDGVSYNVKFRLAAITGDNLGLHTILGFSESFMANHPCRMCRCHKRETRAMIKENPDKLRNIINYREDLLTNDLSETGIKSPCVWNGVHYFDLFTMTAVDVLHDLLEGACVYVLEVVLHGLIANRLVTIDDLNTAIQSFNYGPDRNSKPPLITPSARVKIKMSASECLVFVRYLPIFIGVHVPRTNEFWQLFILLRRILSIAMADVVRPGLANDFSWYVEELNEFYIRLSRSQSLPPKFHHLVHYHRMMNLFGPLRQLWSMRFEGKHRISKISAHASASRVNICQTVMNRHQWQLNQILLNRTISRIHYNCFKKGPIKVGERWHILDMLGLPSNTNLCSIKSFSSNGIMIREGDVLCVNVDETNENLPQFIRLHSLFMIPTGKLFITRPLGSLQYYLMTIILRTKSDWTISQLMGLTHVILNSLYQIHTVTYNPELPM